jgi:HK97 family phage major capsid protein
VPYNGIIGRSDADVFIVPEVAAEVMEAATQLSVALRLGLNVPMSSKQKRMPVLAALPVAYWVGGDTGLKQTTEAQWGSAELEAEELATILPIPEAVLDDSEFDIWAALRPSLAEAIALKLDQAVFTAAADRPASWPQAVIPAAQAAGNVRAIAATAAEGGMYGDLEAVMALVEDDGFQATGFAADSALKRGLRRARSTTGDPLGDHGGSFDTGRAWGVPIEYAIPGVFPTTPTAVHAVGGQWTLLAIGVRQDISYKVLDQAVITDDNGAIVYNLPQQDMIALRVTARFGFAVGVPATRVGAANAYPFATLEGTIATAATRTTKTKTAT